MFQDHPNQTEIKERIRDLVGRHYVPYGTVQVVEDTTSIMNIYRGQILRLGDGEYFILGDIHEPRFGMQDQPKYWVKKVADLSDGTVRIIKLVFHEEFVAHMGPIRIRCFRSPEKEARVLELATGNPRFMQGRAFIDPAGNNVRLIDFINGDTLYDTLMNLEMEHEDYFHTRFPGILAQLCDCMDAIALLHAHGLCHGDIRNDHIIIEDGTELFRWIDFDLTQRFSDYDVWSLGNLLQFCAGKGIRTFHEVESGDIYPDSVRQSLSSDDAMGFYKYRIMNLRKLFGYIPKRFNDILMRFAVNTTTFYDRVDQLSSDVREVLEADFPDRPDPSGGSP